MKKAKKRMGGIEQSWSLSYIAVVFCCVITICGVLSVYGVRMVTDESKKNLEISSQKLADIIDQKIEYMKQIAIKLSVSNWIGYLGSPTLLAGEHQDFITDQYTEAVVELNGNCNVEQSIRNITVFFPFTERVINRKGDFTNDEYFRIPMTYDKKLYQKLLEISDSNKYFEFLHYQINGENAELLVYNCSGSGALIVFEIDNNALENKISFSNAGNKFDQLFIQDKKTGLIAFGAADPLATAVCNTSLSDDNGNGSEYFEVSKSVAAVRIVSNSTPYQYYFTYASDYVTANGKLILQFITVAAIISLILGVLLSFFFITINYKPLQKIIRQISEINGGQLENKNEYEYITNSLTNWSKEVQLTKEYSVKYEKAIWNKFLNSILTGSLTLTENNIKLLSDNLLEYDNEHYYLVVLLGVLEDRIGEIRKQPVPVIEICADCAGRAVAGKEKVILWQYVEINPDKYAIIFRSDAVEDKEVRELEKDFREHIRNAFDTAIVVAEGEWRWGIAGIAVSFQLAEKIHVWQMFTENYSYDGVERFKKSGPHYYFYPHDWENKLIYEAMKGNLEDVNHIIDDIIQENCQNKQLSMQKKRYLLGRVLETAFKILEKLNKPEYELFLQVEQNIDAMNETQSWASIKKLFTGICELGFTNQMKIGESKLFQEIVDYVSENYSDYNISLKDISSKFSVQEYTVSKMFKTITGFNFLDYLNQKRIDCAKTLLKTTDTAIYQIAIQIGFDSDRSFRRVFKKYVGCGPAEYRNFNE